MKILFRRHDVNPDRPDSDCQTPLWFAICYRPWPCWTTAPSICDSQHRLRLPWQRSPLRFQLRITYVLFPPKRNSSINMPTATTTTFPLSSPSCLLPQAGSLSCGSRRLSILSRVISPQNLRLNIFHSVARNHLRWERINLSHTRQTSPHIFFFCGGVGIGNFQL